MNKKMTKTKAPIEALCSLYRLQARLKDQTPSDVIHAIVALELAVGCETAKHYRTQFGV